MDPDEVTLDVPLSLVLLDVSQITEAYSQIMERAELVRSVAAGEPACQVYGRLRRRRPLVS